MRQINLGWCGTLVIGAMIIVSVQCLGNQETYQEAMLKCAKLKTMSERNICRMDATHRYRNVEEDVIIELYHSPKIQRHHSYGEIIDFKEVFKDAE